MSYIAKRLSPGETVVLQGRFHWMQYALAWAALIVLGVLIVGIVIWAREMLRMGTTEFAVTNHRVLLKRGLFTLSLDEITLTSIEGAHVNASPFGRVFGFGRLEVHGSGDTHLLFPTMAHPARFLAAIEGARTSAGVRPLAKA